MRGRAVYGQQPDGSARRRDAAVRRHGDLTEAWSEEGHFELSLDEYGPGRHVVTDRGIDAFGQWTGASIVVGCHGMEPARNESSLSR